MLKSNFTLLIISVLQLILICGNANSQNKQLPALEEINKLIIGKWKSVDAVWKCDEIKGFDEKSKDNFRIQEINFRCNENKTCLYNEVNCKYEIFKAKSSTILSFNGEQNFEIVSINNDSLIISFEGMKTNDPDMAHILEELNAKNDTDKIVSVNITCIKIKPKDKTNLLNLVSMVKPLPPLSEINELIIGKWKGEKVEVSCYELEDFDEEINNYWIQSKLRRETRALSFSFNKDKTFDVGNLSLEEEKDKNYMYEITDKGNLILNVPRHEDNEERKINYKILLISKDSLVISKEVKTSDPALSMVLNRLHAENDTDKIATYTLTYLKYIEPVLVPWTNVVAMGLPVDKNGRDLFVNESRLFAVCGSRNDFDTLFVSNNNGANWYASSNGLPSSIKIRSITSQETKLFLGTNSGLFTSDNNGQSWIKSKSATFNQDNYNYFLIQSTPENIFALAEDKLYISNDKGTTWNSIQYNLPVSISGVSGLLTVNGSVIIIGGDDFLFKSPDNGKTWNNLDENLHKAVGFYTSVNVATIIGTSIFVETKYGTFSTNDDGKTWKEVRNGFPTNDNPFQPFHGSFGDFANSFIHSGKTIFYGCNSGVYLSSDEGNSWTSVNNSELQDGVTSLAIVGSDIFAFTHTKGIWKTSINELVKLTEKQKK